MLLSLRDRLLLPAILPTQGNFDKLMICKCIKDKVKPTKEEEEKHSLFQLGPNKQWDPKTEVLKEYKFNDAEMSAIIEAFKDQSKKGELHDYHVDLYEIFVNGKPNPEGTEEGLTKTAKEKIAEEKARQEAAEKKLEKAK